MRRLRSQVEDHNIYRWAGQLLSAIGKMVPEPLPRPVGVGESVEEDADFLPGAGHIPSLRFANS
jgi:trehalose 6-phosphate synthase